MIYFDSNKIAYGFKILNYIAKIEDSVWAEYAGSDKWDIINGEFVDITNTPEYIEKHKAKERERISHLTCTKRNFALMLQQYGITYSQLKELISTNEQAQLEWDLCVELERSNPLLDVMALQLGITSEQLDGLFRYANGEITIEQFREINKEPDVNNSEPVDEENSVVDEVANEDTTNTDNISI